MKKELRLEVGKTYLNRMGDHVKIVSRSASGSIFIDAKGLDYFTSGKYSAIADSPNDIIEEAITAIPAKLPKNWVVEGTGNREEMEPVVDYIRAKFGTALNGYSKGYYGCLGECPNFYYFFDSELTDDTVILTLEEFKRLTTTTKETEMKNIQRITRENLKEIVDAACSSWKIILSDKAREQDALSSFVEFDNEFVLKMYKAATFSQKLVLDKFLKKPEAEDMIAIPKGVNFHDDIRTLSTKLFGNVNDLQCISFSATKDEYKYRAFYVRPTLEVKINPTMDGGTEIVFLKRKG